VLLVVKQASSKRCRSNFIVVLRLGARARLVLSSLRGRIKGMCIKMYMIIPLIMCKFLEK
jgi:hypothetical protein